MNSSPAPVPSRVSPRVPPRVSVICPTYNRSRAITATLDSVRAQTMPDWEMLVVSDGSDDDTDAWVERAARADSRIRLLRTARHGHPSGPRNLALEEARGSLIAYLDHDDRWREDHLSIVVTALDGDGSGDGDAGCGEDGETSGAGARPAGRADMVVTGFVREDGAGRITARSRPHEMCWHPQFQTLGVLMEPSRVAYRRALGERAGPWHAGGGMEDWDLWLRIADLAPRVTTVLDRTAVLLDDTGTRRHHIRPAHHAPLAWFDDPRHAHATLCALRDGRYDEPFRAAHAADTAEWIERLARTPEFVTPSGRGTLPTAELTRELTAAMTARTPPFHDLVVTRKDRRCVLAQPLRCRTAEHARRIAALVRTTQPRVCALIEEVAAACAPAAPASARGRKAGTR